MDARNVRPTPKREAAYLNEQNSLENKSPISPFSDWAVPFVRKQWTRVCAGINSANTLAALTEVVDCAATKQVISLDFFDTLVIRPVEPPGYVLGKVAEDSIALIHRLAGVRLSKSEYLRGRNYCEQALRAANTDARGLDEEASLPCILDRLLSQLEIHDATLIAELVAAEVALESDVLSLNLGALELLVHLKGLGKRVLVLSDTYMTADHLNLIAQRWEIAGYIDRFYASGDVGLGKQSGRLYEHILQEENIAVQDLLHVGDNLHSDFRVPTKRGIEAKWLYQKKHLRRRLNIERRLRKTPKKFVLGCIEDRARELYTSSEVLERHMFTSLAPAVFCMAYRSLNDCISLGITNLFFLPKKGMALKQVFEVLIANHPEFKSHNFHLSVLYVSKASTVCARFYGTDDVGHIAATALRRLKKLNYENLLASWNIREEDLDYHFSVAPQLETLDDVKSLFATNPKFSAAFGKHLNRQKAYLQDFLQQEGVLGAPCAFIDVGSGGTIQQNIEALGTGAEIYGLYLGTDHRFESRNLKGYLFSPADYRAGGVFKSAPVTETLLSVSDVGTTISYESVDGRILPQLEKNIGLESSCELARNRVFTDYYQVFYTLTRQLCIPSSVLVDVARDQYFKLLCRPDRKFVTAIADLEFAFDWGNSTQHKLVLKLSFKDWFRPKRLLEFLWKSPWLFGTLKANHLGFLNAPVSWLLGHEERISFRKLRKYAPKSFVPS